MGDIEEVLFNQPILASAAEPPRRFSIDIGENLVDVVVRKVWPGFTIEFTIPSEPQELVM